MTLFLQAMSICSAMYLAKADPWTLRKKSNIIFEKTARELAGTPCHVLEEPGPPKLEICYSRMYDKRLTELALIYRGSGQLHDARLGKVAGAEVILQKGLGQ